MDKLNLMPKLTQQVLSNAEEIQRVEAKVDAHYAMDKVLADYGIKVVGSVDTVGELPDPVTYDGAYGDAYTVGFGAPYDFYIFTRPLQGETANRWLDLGALAIEGPEGPQGPSGETGPQGPAGKSSRWYSGQGSPYIAAVEGDMFLDLFSGDVYQYNNSWERIGNIKGATGSQGPRGEQGPVGPTGAQGAQGPRGEAGYSVEIVGILSSAEMLPDPGTVDRHTAYIIEDGQRWLYFITGTTLLDMMWNRVPFSAGTAVMSNDQILGTFDADTKVDKLSQAHILYGTDLNGDVTAYSLDNGEAGSVVLRNGNNTIVVPDPEGELEAANKEYVDSAIANAGYVQERPEGEYDYMVAYINTTNGKPSYARVDSNAEMTAGSLPVYMANGCLNVRTTGNVGTSAVNYNVLARNMTLRSGVKLSQSKATILQILQAAGYTKNEANYFAGRIRIRTNNITANSISQYQGVGLGSSSQATFRELELIFNTPGGNATVIAYPWKPNISPTHYGTISAGTQVYAAAGLGGLYAEIVPDILQSVLL